MPSSSAITPGRELPVLSPAPRPSRFGKWRALSLLLVHVVVAVHVAHFMLKGRTITPVEPSESMYALELGLVNAGFVFFVLAIGATLVFGRYFCGWGCHLVALQDGCSWILRKLSIKPRPVRSRALALAPWALAFYMFAWPSVVRALSPDAPPFPGFRAHFTTTDFWRTFPGPFVAGLTFLTCGFAAVYVLGNKGFCTNGCPYGAFFAAADRLAPRRIVADGCKASGHCTPACTSNVLVHEEVRRHSMVVDSACMKCMDCVSACPNEALGVSWAKPAIFVGPPASRTQYTLGWGEEALVAAVAVGATLAFRGLYDGPPLLMAAALGGITAFVALKLWQLARRPTVRAQSFTLRAGGDLSRSGTVFAIGGAAWMLFAAHSGLVQWHRVRGRAALERTAVVREQALTGRFRSSDWTPSQRAALDDAFRHFSLARRLGLLPVSEVHLGLAWCRLLRHEPGEAEREIRASLAMAPRDAQRHDNLVDLLVAQRRTPDAVLALREKIASSGESAADRFRLGELLAESGDLAGGAVEMSRAVALAPDNPAARYDLGAMLRRLGRPSEAIAHLEAAARLVPGDAQTQDELAKAIREAAQP